MSTCYCDGGLIVTHHLAQQFCAGQHWNTGSFGSGKFRIVRMNGCGVDHHINARSDIFGGLSIKDGCSFFFQMTGQCGSLTVRAGYGKSLLQQNFSQTAHTDTADTDKMYMYR